MFGVFHDAGYRGMYGGLGRDAIKRRKKIPEKENLTDRMDSTELAANQFRMTQAREKLARDGIKTGERAIRAHEQVGKEVREAIRADRRHAAREHPARRAHQGRREASETGPAQAGAR
ncbi:DNA-damage-inducible protein D [Aquisphaera giovannonii]|uniref:DNA-damage-inducible protein D n=1 Tax=Aquisphaera giovannonii TaxID=406548 RepID=A0A5B9WEZ9_9BACT|nr:hypothetical protein [Aquisphaera giovannonii]QEH39117.1 DNA-damage-inducible protein D [Aquisphaera giovannonii]